MYVNDDVSTAAGFFKFIYLAAQGLSCGTQDLRCHVRDLHRSTWDL